VQQVHHGQGLGSGVVVRRDHHRFDILFHRGAVGGYCVNRRCVDVYTEGQYEGNKNERFDVVCHGVSSLWNRARFILNLLKLIFSALLVFGIIFYFAIQLLDFIHAVTVSTQPCGRNP
jgi:hypothetical protein